MSRSLFLPAVALVSITVVGGASSACGADDPATEGDAATTATATGTGTGDSGPVVLEDGAIVDPPPPPPPLPTSGGGHFYYTLGNRILRIAAKQGAQAENISLALDRVSRGSRDRYPAASLDGAWLVFAASRFGCQSECLVRVTRDLSSGEAVKPGGEEIYPEGMSAITSNGDLIVFPATGGPHRMDLWVTRRQGNGWSAKQLLTAASPYPYNNMAALTFDGQRVTFDCGQVAYPEGGINDACEVGVTGSGFKKLVGRDALPNPRQNHVQNPHEGLDGLLFEAAWPVGQTSPEIVWLLPKAGGAPTAIAKSFNNSVAPCPLPDGRFGILWLESPNNPQGKHELTVVERDGSKGTVLTPGIDVVDDGVGCSD
jgi:hypothetical protein